MAKRLILMLGVVAVLLAGLGFAKFRQIESAVHASAFQPPPEAVTSVVAQRGQWPVSMTAIGTMEAVHGVMVSADLPGTVCQHRRHSILASCAVLLDDGDGDHRAGCRRSNLTDRHAAVDGGFGEPPKCRQP